MSKMSYQVIKLTANDVLRLRVKAKRKVPYNEIIGLLTEGHEVFIPEMNRKTASYVKRVLTKRIGATVECFPSSLGGMDGYTFKLSIVHEYLKSLSQRET